MDIFFILAFIAMAAHSGMDWLYWAVTPASILGQVAIGLLELFVSFLQAYIFAFLATLFIGTAVHPH
jgi:F-type H+-transporting ATPase subunit a